MPLQDATARGGLRWTLALCAIGLGVCFCLFACSSVNPVPDGDGPDPGGGVGPDGGTTPDNPPDDGGTSGDSVGDVVTDPPAHPQPTQGGVTARVRNESTRRADVTLRFIQTETVVHLAFVRVLPSTVATIESPKSADLIELSGVDERGQALASATLAFGTDFDDATPAVYTIPGDLGPLTLNMLEPETDITRVLGATFVARWNDESEAPGTVVRVYLQPIGSPVSERVRLGQAVGAALDGLSDELLLVVQGVPTGVYEVGGEIDDGTTQVTSIAPGRLTVLEDPGNTAPTIRITAPLERTELRADQTLSVSWEDADDEDNATITFWLESPEGTEVPVGPFAIGPPLAEDPDGVSADSAELALGDDVLPGLYDLVGRIFDGEADGDDRIMRVVEILPEPENDPPWLQITEPPLGGAAVEIAPSDSFLVRWEDSDEDNNAQISILLDPNLSLDASGLGENAILLAGSLGEDDETDEIVLGVPDGTPDGDYRVVAIITDGSVPTPPPARGGILRIDSTDEAEPGGSNDPPILELWEPSDEVFTRLGDDFNVKLHVHTTDVPEEAEIQLFLSNLPDGGLVRVEVTPSQLIRDQETTLALGWLTDAIIPNDAWPRKFWLEAELGIDEGPPTVALAPIWIRQEVVIEAHRTVYTCESSVDDRDPDENPRLEIDWYGGGFEEVAQGERPAPVEFWLSNDGAVGTEDDYHRLLPTSLLRERPNDPQTEQIGLWNVVGFPDPNGDGSTAVLASGFYQLILVVRPQGLDPIQAPPYPDEPFEICYRISVSGGGGGIGDG